MKKSILALFIALFAGVALAVPVTEADARIAAGKWASENAAISGDMGYAVEAVAEKSAEGNLLWWVVKMSNGGAVITAPDTDIEPIVTVLKKYKESLPKAHPLRALLTMDMTARLSKLQCKDDSSINPSIATSIKKSIATANEKWAKYLAPAVLFSVEGETIRTGDPAYVLGLVKGFEEGGVLTHWDQDVTALARNPMVYNLHTPSNYVCGCATVAGSAILQYFNVTQDPGVFSNKCSVAGVATNLVSIPGGMDWSILPKEMGGAAEGFDGELTAEQVDLLGRVAYNVGVAIHTDYAKDNSGSYTFELATTFRDHFGMADARNVKLEDTSDYEKFIYSQLRCSNPVLLSIRGEVGGHAIVATGYGRDANYTEYTRLFLGWSGDGDAWYCLPNIDAGVDSEGNDNGLNFGVVIQVITMLGTSDATMPLYGRVRDVDGAVADTEVTITAASGNITVKTDANGYWSTLVSPSEFSERGNIVSCTVDGVTQEKTFNVGSAVTNSVMVVDDGIVLYPFDADDADALPSSLDFMYFGDLVVADSRQSVKELALEQNKAVLLFSYEEGNPDAEMIADYLLKYSDSLADDYVLYMVDAFAPLEDYPDGFPSIGIFNPNRFDDDFADMWKFYNGRLAYLCQNDFEGYDVDDINAALDEFFEEGYLKWCSVMRNNQLTITGMLGEEFAEIGASVFTKGGMGGYGVYTNFYELSNVVFYEDKDVVSVETPLYVTNTTDEAGNVLSKNQWVIYKCSGWVLKDGDLNVIASNDVEDVNIASFAMNGSNLDWTLTWLWETNSVWVTVEAINSKFGNVYSEDGMIDIRNEGGDWFELDKEVHLIAVPKTGYRLVEVATNKVEFLDLPTNLVVAANHISFTAYAYSLIRVSFDYADESAGEVNLTVKTDSAANKIADVVPNVLFLGQTPLAYDTASAIPNQGFSLVMPSNIVTDVDTRSWNLIGWVLNDGESVTTNNFNVATNVTSIPLYADVTNIFTSGASVEVTWLWKKQRAIDPEDLVVEWNDTMDNLSEGTNNVLIATEDLPPAFTEDEIEDLTNDLAAPPKGWVYGEPALVLTEEGLVANLELDVATLTPTSADGTTPVLSIAIVYDKVHLTGDIDNGVKGFWYSVLGSLDVRGPWKLIGTSVVEGDPTTQASSDGPLHIFIKMNPDESLQFFKIVVTSKEPESE